MRIYAVCVAIQRLRKILRISLRHIISFNIISKDLRDILDKPIQVLIG